MVIASVDIECIARDEKTGAAVSRFPDASKSGDEVIFIATSFLVGCTHAHAHARARLSHTGNTHARTIHHLLLLLHHCVTHRTQPTST